MSGPENQEDQVEPLLPRRGTRVDAIIGIGFVELINHIEYLPPGRLLQMSPGLSQGILFLAFRDVLKLHPLHLSPLHEPASSSESELQIRRAAVLTLRITTKESVRIDFFYRRVVMSVRFSANARFLNSFARPEKGWITAI